MTDLDIQIDVPDDDDLGSPVRVLNGSWVPPWLKAVAVLIVGALLALGIAAFLLGRSRAEEPPALVPPTVQSTELASAATSPSIEASLVAVQQWQAFAETGDLSALEGFDPDGPQYRLLAQSSVPSDSGELEFAARNLTESVDGVMTTVSLDMVVSGPNGQEVYPYDFVYLDGLQQVWTVIDRRSPGTAALPPAADMIEAAKQSWRLFTSSMSIGDGEGVIDVVSADTATLADQILAAEPGSGDPALVEVELYDLLVERSRQATAETPGEVVIAMLDAGQRQTLVVGELTSWTQTDPDKIIASLEVAGEPVAVVPFVATTEGWQFDLVAAMNTSGGSR